MSQKYFKNNGKVTMNNVFSYQSPSAHKTGSYGYKPNVLIKVIRWLARIVISVIRLNGNSRFCVELQQQIDPKIGIDLPNGEKLYFCTGHGRLVWRAKTLFSEEEGLIRWIDSFNEQDVFYDIGANVGNYSLYAAKTKKIPVYAFEPEINNLQLLYANIHKNSLGQFCIPVPLACDHETKIKPFYIREFTKGGAINSVGRESIFLETKDQLFVQKTLCMPIDDMIKIFNMQKPTKVKIDVDTNELNIVEGMKKILPYIKEIYIELYSPFPEHAEVINILKNEGFKVESIISAKAPEKYKEEANYLFKKDI